MGLTMREKKALTNEIAARYRRESKTGKLCKISAATVDRLLKPERRTLDLTGRSHTKHGLLVKHRIPIRTSYGEPPVN